MLAGAQLCMMHAAWKPELGAKIATYSILALKDRSEIGFESIICLAGKVTWQWNKLYY